MVQPSAQVTTLSRAPVDVAGDSHVGQVRRVNEDSFVVAAEFGLYAVADGMGGHGAGDVASQLTVSTLCNELRPPDRIGGQAVPAPAANHRSTGGDDAADSPPDTATTGRRASPTPADTLVQAVAAANLAVRNENRQAGFTEGTGMGTTLVGLFGDPASGHLLAFNIGDSRLYRFRNGRLTQLTQDHTLYQEWVEGGQSGPAPPRNIILRALGLFDEIDLDLIDVEVASGDLLLLCSDGLSGMLDDEQLNQSLQSHAQGNLEELNTRLIEQANARGGEDNISVVTLRAA